MKARVLIVDDEKGIRDSASLFFKHDGYDSMTAAGVNEALEIIKSHEFDLFFIDIILGDQSGIEVLKEIKKQCENCQVIMFTGYPTIDTAAEALRLGAYDYIPKPVKKDVLLRAAQKAMERKNILDKNESYRIHLEAIIHSSQDAIITINHHMNVIETNKQHSFICNVRRDNIAGKHIASIGAPCSKKCIDALKETARTRKQSKINHLECVRRDRPNQIVSLSTYPLLTRKGSYQGSVMTIKDETYLYELEDKKGQRRQLHNLIGVSRLMQSVFSLIESLSRVNSTVLITGESGTGKELVVDALHHLGASSRRPLVKVNCAALADNLLESELFGHVKGSFTGAIGNKAGKFEKADGGTVFLDEIGDISPALQVRLLRVLQEKEIERVGDTGPIKIDVRILAATNKNLAKQVRLGAFREDLYYRLHVVELQIPPLRERVEDIPLLTEHFIKVLNKKMHKKIEYVSTEVMNIFTAYAWPGNVRELEHSLESAFILCNQSIITIDHIPEKFTTQKPLFVNKDADNKEEIEIIMNALEKTDWNKAKTARVLGISRKTLYKKLFNYKIEDKRP